MSTTPHPPFPDWTAEYQAEKNRFVYNRARMSQERPAMVYKSYEEMKATVRSEPLVTQTLGGDTLCVHNWLSERVIKMHAAAAAASSPAVRASSAEELAAQRDTYRCVEGGGGVALRNSPVFTDRGGRGPEDQALVEAIGKPEVHSNLLWIPLANGSWLPITTENKSKVLFELVPELSNIASPDDESAAGGAGARVLPSGMMSPGMLAVEFQKGDRVLRGDDVQLLELCCIDAVQFDDVTLKEFEPFARLVAFAMDTARVPADAESATLLALALAAARKLNLHPGIRQALIALSSSSLHPTTLFPPSASAPASLAASSLSSASSTSASPFVQFASLARSPSGLLARQTNNQFIDPDCARGYWWGAPTLLLDGGRSTPSVSSREVSCATFSLY